MIRRVLEGSDWHSPSKSADHGHAPRDAPRGRQTPGRAAQGVRLIDIEDDDRVVGLAKLGKEEAAADGENDGGALDAGGGENGTPAGE